MTDAEDFLAVSRILTGERELPEGVAEAYRARLDRAYPAPMTALLEEFRKLPHEGNRGDHLEAALEQKPELVALAKELITVWYTSQFTLADGKTQDGPGSVEEYRSGLLWKVIQAHPPGVSAGPYGYWEYQQQR
jgi:Membrane bound FAD containing D-sorbitol dehydrogenase